MGSNQAASQFSNSPSGIEISPPYDSAIDTLVKNDAMNNNNDNRSSGSSFITSSLDEDFASGEEEFETRSERSGVVEPAEEIIGNDIEGENFGTVFVGVSEILTSEAEIPADDDVEKVFEVEETIGNPVEGEKLKEIFVDGSVILLPQADNPVTVATLDDDDVQKGPEGGVLGGEYVEEDGIVTGEVFEVEETIGKHIEGENLSEIFVGGGFEILMPQTDSPVTVATLADDVEKNPKVRVLGGEWVEEDGIVTGEETKGVDDGTLDGIQAEQIVAEHISRKPAITVEPILGENSNLDLFVKDTLAAEGFSRNPEVIVEQILVQSPILSQSMEEGDFVVTLPQALTLEVSAGSKGDNDFEISELDETTSSEVEGSFVPKEVVMEETKLKEEKVLNAEDCDTRVEAKESEEVFEASPVLSQTNDVSLEPENSELIEADTVKFKNEGDSLAEAIHVKLLEPGVVLVNGSDDVGVKNSSTTSTDDKIEVEQSEPSGVTECVSEAKLNELTVMIAAGGGELVSTKDLESNVAYENHVDHGLAEDEVKNLTDEEGDIGYSGSDEETDGVIFGSSEAARQFMEELEQGPGGEDQPRGIFDGQIVTDSDKEVDTNEEIGGKELFDSAALDALLKAATCGCSDGGNFTITSQDGSSLFSIERSAGLGSSTRSSSPATKPNQSSPFSSSGITTRGDPEYNLTEKEEEKLAKLQQLRVKFLRLVQRLGVTPDESVATQVLYRLALVGGRQSSEVFNLDDAKRSATLLEEEGKVDLDFSVNILVLGKSGVGKSATINSIFGEEKSFIDAFECATATVKEISGVVNGVKIKVLDTPGLKTGIMEQGFNRSVLSSVIKFTKKTPPDIILYVDRLDLQTRNLNDSPLLKTITSCLGASIWRSAIVALTHGASAPPDGPSGSPLSYDVFVTQRSHVVQQSIGQAVGDIRMMSPSLMNPVSLVENHPLCRKNREGQKVLPNGQTWRPHLLLLGYSMKILSEATSLSKPQDAFDHRKLFGFRTRSPPLPYLLSSMLQTKAHPKLSSDQGIENGDSDVDLGDLSDCDEEEEGEDEYDKLPFRPLSKAQIAKLSKEDKEEYFNEYDNRVKLLNKKHWREEAKRMKEMKKKSKDAANENSYIGEEGDLENGSAAPVSTPLPDMILPPSFDSDSSAYRYRFLEPTSQFLARPVLDTHGWDHDCGYDGVNLEQNLAIANCFPAAVSVQITKDKKDFSIHLDSSVSAKHGESGSSMAGFIIQNIGKQLAYIVRGETKFKNMVGKKKNKTAAGLSITFLGDNVATGLKMEDQIALAKQWALVGSCGTVRCQSDAAYGANFELQRRELDYPIGQVQSTYGGSLIKWKGNWALGFNTVAQFSIGHGSKASIRAGINNKMTGQITVSTTSSEHIGIALAAVIPFFSAIFKKIWPAAAGVDNYSIY